MRDVLEEAGVGANVNSRAATGILVAFLAAMAALFVFVPGSRTPLLLVARHRAHGDAPRGRPLRGGQALGHEGHRVLRRLRAAPLVVHPRRDRIRREGHPRRRLRAHHRHDQHGRGRPGRRVAHLPSGAAREAPRHHPRRHHRQPDHRLRAVLRGDRRPGPRLRRPQHHDRAHRRRQRRARGRPRDRRQDRRHQRHARRRLGRPEDDHRAQRWRAGQPRGRPHGGQEVSLAVTPKEREGQGFLGVGPGIDRARRDRARGGARVGQDHGQRARQLHQHPERPPVARRV